jgi:hypothetical protein
LCTTFLGGLRHNHGGAGYGGAKHCSVGYGDTNHGGASYGFANHGSAGFGGANHGGAGFRFANHGGAGFGGTNHGGGANHGSGSGGANHGGAGFGSTNHGGAGFGSVNHGGAGFGSASHGGAGFGSTNHGGAGFGSANHGRQQGYTSQRCRGKGSDAQRRIKHLARIDTNSGPTGTPIICPVVNEVNPEPTVKPTNHPAATVANFRPTGTPIIRPAVNKANPEPTVEPINHPETTVANSRPTGTPIIRPVVNKANARPTNSDYPNIINLFNFNTPISILQFSPYANKDEDNETVIPETQNLESGTNLESEFLEDGCMTCKRDDYHDKLLLCDRCNGGYHTYCLNPPLHLVLEYDFFCQKCKEAGKDDGMLKLIKNLPNNYSDRFGEIVWVDGGQGYGYWPAVVLDPLESSGRMRAQYRKMLGKQFIVGLFKCTSNIKQTFDVSSRISIGDLE